MSLRTMYLTRGPRVSGHGHFAGRLMYQVLRGASDEVLLGWGVLDSESDDSALPMKARDDLIKAKRSGGSSPTLFMWKAAW